MFLNILQLFLTFYMYIVRGSEFMLFTLLLLLLVPSGWPAGLPAVSLREKGSWAEAQGTRLVGN